MGPSYDHEGSLKRPSNPLSALNGTDLVMLALLHPFTATPTDSSFHAVLHLGIPTSMPERWLWRALMKRSETRFVSALTWTKWLDSTTSVGLTPSNRRRHWMDDSNSPNSCGPTENSSGFAGIPPPMREWKRPTNDYGTGSDKISIPPTLLFSLFGDHPDVRKSATSDFKFDGDKIYLVGESKQGFQFQNSLSC